AGLLALAGVLGIGEGHLLHQKTRWGGVRLFCQNQKVFFRLSLVGRESNPTSMASEGNSYLFCYPQTLLHI
ncbi:hypothetical protein ACUS6V_32030, partial [Pseudomonas aeruginosa]|uniref:hypothetical protein n=1 Tax=Pseudomonas aeruginosa TaxID=287 RepID=UPI00405394D5